MQPRTPATAEDPLSCPVPLLHAFFKAAAAQAPTYPPHFHQDFVPSDFLPSILQAEHLSPPESSCYIKCTDQGKAIQAKDGKKPHCNVGSGTLQPSHSQLRVSIARHIQQGPQSRGGGSSTCFCQTIRQKKRQHVPGMAPFLIYGAHHSQQAPTGATCQHLHGLVDQSFELARA